MLDLFETDPREYVHQLAFEYIVDKERLLEIILCHMTTDDIRDMLDAEELSPRFIGEDPSDD